MAKGKVLKTIIDISGEISPTLGKSLEGVVDKLEGVNVKAMAVGVSLAALGGAAIVGVGKAVGYLSELGTEYDKASNQMAASTGLVGDELANMEQQMRDVYKGNFGDSMHDVAEGISEVYRQTGLAGDALQATTEGAFALRDTFGYDVTESARAAKAMITNFGISGEEAMSLIAAGAQNGLDFSGELIDTINEYSVQFAKLGFSADDMFHIFQKGAESGAWNLDKVGDAIKEFSIRSIDGSKATTTAFTDLGLNAETMMATFAKGGENAENAFQQVVQKLIDVDDQVKRDEIGVALFGTMWEDLGVDAVSALAAMENSAYDTGEALEGINKVKYRDLDSAMQGIKRTAEVALIPAAEKVSEAFIKLSPKIEGAIEAVAPYITTLAEQLGPVIEKAIELGEQGFGFIAQKIGELAPVVSNFVDGGLVWMRDNASWLIPVIAGLTGALAAYKIMTIAVSIVEAIKNSAFIASIATMNLATIATTALGAATAFLTSPIFLVALAIGALIAVGVALWKNWDVIKEKATQLGAWLGKVWERIKTTCSAAWSAIVSALSSAWSWIVSAASSFFSGVATTISSIWSSIQATCSAVWSGIIEDLSALWSSMVSTASNFFSNVASTLSAAWSGLKSTATSIWNGVLTAITNVINRIKSTIKSFISNVTNTLSSGWSKLTSILTAPFDALKGIVEDVMDKIQGLISKIGEITGIDFSNIKIPGFASGGFTSGLSIAGEDPRYPTEAVISFNPAYRDQNLSYWAQAGRMLGADYSDYTIGGGTGATYFDLGGVTFAPNVTIHGDADRRTVMEAIEDEYPEFLDMLEKYLNERGDPVYA